MSFLNSSPVKVESLGLGCLRPVAFQRGLSYSRSQYKVLDVQVVQVQDGNATEGRGIAVSLTGPRL